MQTLLKLIGLLLALSCIAIAGFMWIYNEPDRPVVELVERWTDEHSQFINIDGMQVHVNDQGPKSDPVPLLLLHGTSASLHTWNGWVDEIKKQSPQPRRIVRFDMQAFGLTGPHPNNDYSIQSYANTVRAVMDALNIEKAIIAGNSLGGYVAWATAVIFPERVDRLILIDASGLPFKAKSIPLAFKIASSPVMSAILGNTLPRFVIRQSIENVYSDNSKISDDLVKRYFELTLREGNRDALEQRFKQTQANDFAKRVSEIKQPTLILWGEYDNLIPVALGDEFNQLIPNSELIVFGKLGHVPQEEDPYQTVKNILSFID
ncbi:alpha/beta fold hydrolase [Glaciecola petra]|uniref:Alpha/beta hydrolase n=1 Tax=Glaciecola petra TaxID=3075602 RepID=A0ABU2ZR30_9ALTE|nr:alpha/beta hydrolase [Aestuariibacter sp. P117]MDT0595090.1 alpha/beta hydrolase [Aestuariibacter sp. P117]